MNHQAHATKLFLLNFIERWHARINEAHNAAMARDETKLIYIPEGKEWIKAIDDNIAVMRKIDMTTPESALPEGWLQCAVDLLRMKQVMERLGKEAEERDANPSPRVRLARWLHEKSRRA